MIGSLPNDDLRWLATLWRPTVEAWLRRQELICVRQKQNQKVSANFPENWSHYKFCRTPMKSLKMKQSILWLAVALGALSVAGSETNRVTIKYPSDLLGGASKGKTIFSLDFVVRPIYDFRLMYCDEETMQTRIASNVCVIDFTAPNIKPKELAVSMNSTLGSVLRSSGIKELEKWPGNGQPFVRVVTKRAILAHDGTAQFLSTPIHPGDFIVVGRVE